MDDLQTALTRGVHKIYPSESELTKLLESKQKISLYCGYDPTATQLHIGHVITLQKLADFQRLGHKVIFLIGDFTGMIGDPTDKSATRTKLSRDQVLQNAKTFKDQAAKILDFESSNKGAEVKFNSEWNDKLNFVDLIELASNITIQQLIERDMFQKRLKENKPISLHEFLYPLIQGYDSVAMEVDLEVGGSDQTFNMLMGRQLMKSLKSKEKFVLTMQLLEDGHGRKMSKSEGNFVAIDDTPNDMYRKVMAFPDSLIIPAFTLCTRVELDKIKQNEAKISQGANPIDIKKELAYEIVRMLHSESDAQGAKNEFERVVQSGELPLTVPSQKLETKEMSIKDLLTKYMDIPSNSEAVRLILQGAVEYNGVRLNDPNALLMIEKNAVLKVGKSKFKKFEI